jgi:hypothetical protein
LDLNFCCTPDANHSAICFFLGFSIGTLFPCLILSAGSLAAPKIEKHEGLIPAHNFSSLKAELFLPISK